MLESFPKKLDARQQAAIAARQAATDRDRLAAIRARDVSTEAVTGQVVGRDSGSGDLLIATPSGGTLRVRSTANTALPDRVQVNSAPGSQQATCDGKPFAPGLEDLYNRIAELEALVLRLVAVQVFDPAVQDEPEARYDGDRRYNLKTSQFEIWSEKLKRWNPVAGLAPRGGPGSPKVRGRAPYDLWSDTAGRKMYAWTGEKWVNVACCEDAEDPPAPPDEDQRCKKYATSPTVCY